MLVVEDEPLVALDLELGLADAGATVLGPASRCSTALNLIGATSHPLDAAVLDVTLGTETCESIALRLLELEVPFLLHTGNWRAVGELVEALGAPVLTKPTSIDAIVATLAQLKEPA